MLSNITNEELLRLLIRERGVVKLLRTIGSDSYPTRELLNILKEWGYGHILLLKANKLGLVERERVRNQGKGNWRVYNRLTKKGRDVIKLAELIGV